MERLGLAGACVNYELIMTANFVPQCLDMEKFREIPKLRFENVKEGVSRSELANLVYGTYQCIEFKNF